MTPRECARIQGFPENFIINKSDGKAYKQFGNSVNVDVVKLFAEFLLDIGNTSEIHFECTVLSVFSDAWISLQMIVWVDVRTDADNSNLLL